LQVEGEKMSKSLGNFVTIHDLLRTEIFGGRSWPGEVLRLAMLATHYTQPIDWTVSILEEAFTNLSHWKKIVSQVDVRKTKIQPDQSVVAALLDDLNTPEVLRCLHKIAGATQRNDELRDVLYDSLVFLGVLPDEFEIANEVAEEVRAEITVPSITVRGAIHPPEIEAKMERFFLSLPSSSNSTSTITTASIIFSGVAAPYGFLDDWVKYNPYYISSRDREYVDQVIGIKNLNGLIERRLQARKEKQFVESDRIRDDLAALNISLNDSKAPGTGEPTTTWEVVR
jgi:cysteinyl-tRNA synthetase